ncbi:hypothetical protein WICMUC_000018 [Wickerhamomyces mucosus]|uniref:Uncharacterized protein n=1 Tax=Wickerhamomyces mucosus TaxID=1378264 RepID=A0A9P8PZH2_9ASCO|nr:hypothetical protein WICMUC_000018 [Wickerhamomyces mucosus]
MSGIQTLSLVPSYAVYATNVTTNSTTNGTSSSSSSSASASHSSSSSGASSIQLSWKAGVAIGALVASPVILSLGL